MIPNKVSLYAGGCLLLLMLSNCKMKDTLNQTASRTLITNLAEQSGFIKAHAAEYLLGVGDTPIVRKTFLTEDELHGAEPRYRIVIWRVLAQTEHTEAGKMKWVDKVLDVFGDLQAPDRLHASETLARLGVSPMERLGEATQLALHSDNPNLRVYTRWAISFSSDSILAENKKKFLDFAASDSILDIRKISAYILRHIKGLSPDQWSRLAGQALHEPLETGFRQNFLNTAYLTYPGPQGDTALYHRVSEGVLENHTAFSAEDRIGLAQALAEKGTQAEIPLLEDYLKNDNADGRYEPDSPTGSDVRAAAAYAILKISAREHEH